MKYNSKFFEYLLWSSKFFEDFEKGGLSCLLRSPLACMTIVKLPNPEVHSTHSNDMQICNPCKSVKIKYYYDYIYAIN